MAVGSPAPLELGLCSWSLKMVEEPDLRPRMQQLGLRVLHLSLSPIAKLPASEQTRAIAAFAASPLIISAGMTLYAGEDYTTLETIRKTGGLVPDETADERSGHIMACAHIAHQLGLKLLSTHAGFIPHEAEDPKAFRKLVDRIGRIADGFAPLGLSLLFETGQERAEDLVAFLTALGRKNVGANFDPANMMLYGKGDPVAAIHTLGDWIKHVHAKDTRLLVPPPTDPTVWKGKEIAIGDGDVPLVDCIGALKKIGYRGPIVIEREAGADRMADARKGIEFLRRAIG